VTTHDFWLYTARISGMAVPERTLCMVGGGRAKMGRGVLKISSRENLRILALPPLTLASFLAKKELPASFPQVCYQICH